MLTGNKSDLHPITQSIIALDEDMGLSREEILERRAGIMTKEFLGFIPEHVFMVYPKLALFDRIEIEGKIIEIPRFRPGN